MALRFLGAAASAADHLLDIADLDRLRPPQWTLRASADATTAATTLADTALMVTTLPVGTYVLDAFGVHSSSAASQGPRYALGAASGTIGTAYGQVLTPTSTTAPAWTVLAAAATGYGANLGAASTLLPFEVHVSFTVTAAGKVGLRWASSATTATQTLKAGSYAVIRTLGP